MAKMTVFKNGILADNAIEKTADYTVVSNTDSGKTFNVNSSITFTLPAIAIGNIFTFVYSGNDGKEILSLALTQQMEFLTKEVLQTIRI